MRKRDDASEAGLPLPHEARQAKIRPASVNECFFVAGMPRGPSFAWVYASLASHLDIHALDLRCSLAGRRVLKKSRQLVAAIFTSPAYRPGPSAPAA